MLSIPNIPGNQVETYRFTNSHLVLVRRIMFQGKPAGLVYIRADLREIDQRLKRYAAIALAVLLLSLIAALLVSSLFGRSVAQPIVDLAQVAAAVSQDKNYSARFHCEPGSGRSGLADYRLQRDACGNSEA